MSKRSSLGRRVVGQPPGVVGVSPRGGSSLSSRPGPSQSSLGCDNTLACGPAKSLSPVRRMQAEIALENRRRTGQPMSEGNLVSGQRPPANAAAAGNVHQHRASREWTWLGGMYRAPRNATRHSCFVRCGSLRCRARTQAEPLGFFERGLAARPKCEDPYGTSGRIKRRADVEAVRSFRRNFDEKFIIRPLPNNCRGRREEASR